MKVRYLPIVFGVFWHLKNNLRIWHCSAIYKNYNFPQKWRTFLNKGPCGHVNCLADTTFFLEKKMKKSTKTEVSSISRKRKAFFHIFLPIHEYSFFIFCNFLKNKRNLQRISKNLIHSYFHECSNTCIFLFYIRISLQNLPKYLAICVFFFA